MKDWDKPFDEKVELLINGCLEVAEKHGISPSNKIFNYFDIQAKKPFIFREMQGDLDEALMNECNVLYRHYFPEGR